MEKILGKIICNLPLAEGLIEMTIPEKPQSSKQRYRLTSRGANARKI